MAGQMEVRISANYARWVRGFAEMGETFEREADSMFNTVSERMFDRSQEYVHVISGELKRSGSQKTERERGQIVSTIRYDAPYAIYEHARGGPHAFMSRAYEAIGAQFEEAFPKAFEAVVDRWR